MRLQKKVIDIIGVDLFCGVGGLTHGLLQGGINVRAGFDLDETCKYPYESNNNAIFIKKDVRELQKSDINIFFKKDKLRLLAGCAPCQPFSTYNQKNRKVQQDGKWDLLLEFGRLIREIQPELITMENVPQLSKQAVFKSFLDTLTGYYIWHGIVDCVLYGIPQTRKRLVLLGSKLGTIALNPPIDTSNNCSTVRNAISNLPKISAGESDSTDPLHTACSLTAKNLERIRISKPGGSWRDWPVELRATCHQKLSGSTYPSVYGRMEWDAPAPTITTQCFGFGNGRFGHPEQDRAISLREAAIIQSFPKDYKFIKPGDAVKINVLGRLIGNAVPVRIGKIVADSLMSHVTKLNIKN